MVVGSRPSRLRFHVYASVGFLALHRTIQPPPIIIINPADCLVGVLTLRCVSVVPLFFSSSEMYYICSVREALSICSRLD